MDIWRTLWKAANTVQTVPSLLNEPIPPPPRPMQIIAIVYRQRRAREAGDKKHGEQQ